MTQLTLNETVNRLKELGYAVQRSGDSYRSQCPAHQGKDLNLALAQGENGQAILTCHSHHCSYEEIMNALDNDSPPVKRAAYGKTLYSAFDRAVEASSFGAGQKRKPDTIYRYENIGGGENLFILRWDTENGKIIRPVSKTDGGYFAGTRTDEPYPVYRLPQLAAYLKDCDQPRLFICEGEKAADAAVNAGLQATTSAFGAGSANKTDWATLDHLCPKNTEIIILPDNDQPGTEYAETLADIFANFKSAPIVKLVRLPNLPEGGDFADWTGTMETLETLINETQAETEIAEPLEWEPFPADLLPESIAMLCKEASASKNIEPVYVGIHALAAVSSVIGSAYKVALKNDWQEPAIIWTCLVSESGSGKTPGLDSAIAPLRVLQKQADKEYDEQYPAYEFDKMRFDIEFDEWRRNKKRDPDNPPTMPKEPASETFIIDDATLEAIAEVLENNPFGILLLKDELAGWFNSFDCYRSGGGAKDLPSWLSIHGGRPFRIDRKTGKKSIRADNPAVSVCGGIQPNVLFRIVKGNEDFFDSGLTARILFAMPPDKPSFWTEVETSDTAVLRYENLFRTLWQWRKDREKPNPEKPLLVRLSQDAKEQFIRFYNANSTERCHLAGDMKAAWAKFTGYAARLALVFHIVQRIEDGQAMDVLQGDSMQRAIRLIDWFKREAARIIRFLGRQVGDTEPVSEFTAIQEAIERNGGSITPRELQLRRRKYRGQGGIKQARHTLDTFVQEGKLIASEQHYNNGKQGISYSLNVTGR